MKCVEWLFIMSGIRTPGVHASTSGTRRAIGITGLPEIRIL
ncbi:hypothetical protein CHK_2135 [Christensenella hongkongensis]|uniref:Uncharacterized protein n=1 Tax=Christensenella hongkongensis TaxID=270498 RepID=A0A0M2NI23_9FIRM|nr:hypothetical protein CHK_2135 [Christensenella hongkongensis]